MKINVILIAMVAMVGCKSSNQSDLKDDILVKNDNEAVLYWLITSGQEQHVCRAVCDESKIVRKGDLQETRNSCDKANMQSIPAEVFKSEEGLQDLFLTFTESISPKTKVVILSTQGRNETVSEQNKKTIQTINSLFTSENMYLADNVRKAWNRGLDIDNGDGVESVLRHHPRCLDPKAAVGNQVATNVGSGTEEDKEVLEEPKLKIQPSRVVLLSKGEYESLNSYLEMLSKKPANYRPTFNRDDRLDGDNFYNILRANKSNGVETIFLANNSEWSAIRLNNKIGPMRTFPMNGSASDTHLLPGVPNRVQPNADAMRAWTDFADALYKLHTYQSPTFKIAAKRSDVVRPSYIVTWGTSESENLSSPGRTLQAKIRVTPFFDERNSQRKYYGFEFRTVTDGPAAVPNNGQ